MLRRTLARQHRFLGIILLLPFITWSLTGVFFLVRPGYAEAYESVPVRQYVLPSAWPVRIEPGWRELRYFRSVLGDHLIVRTAAGWRHLHAGTGAPWPLPKPDALARLLQDAFQFNPDRYGRVAEVEGARASTDTGVEIQVNWDTLTISQYGRDSRWIDRIYSIHYLEWSGIRFIDRVLGLTGLILLLYMSYTGALMAFARKEAAAVSAARDGRAT